MMIRIREFEDMVGESYLRGYTAGSMLHLSVGEEAVAAGIVRAMGPHDVFTTHHRGHGIFLARGADPVRMFAEVFGKSDGYCKGKGGSMHIADIKLGHMGANAIVGANIPISLGGGFSLKYRKVHGASVAFFGDGALNQGVLYESMNMAALWSLPVLFAVVNNQYGMGTRVDRASASLEFVTRAESFGVKGLEVDGMEVEAVYAAADELLEHTRSGKGAAFLVANAYRFYGHGRKDPSPYRSKDEGKSGGPVIRCFFSATGLCRMARGLKQNMSKCRTRPKRRWRKPPKKRWAARTHRPGSCIPTCLWRNSK